MQDTNTATTFSSHMYSIVKFAKIREEAKIPQKRTADAGYDVYACFDEPYIEIKPHETKMIPTGIASCCGEEYCFIVKERGSTGSKGLGLRCGVIDSNYRGEWFIAITNHNDRTVYIAKEGTSQPSWNINNAIVYPYEKAIAQTLIIPVPHTIVEVIDYEDLQNIYSERGDGKLGSSNK